MEKNGKGVEPEGDSYVGGVADCIPWVLPDGRHLTIGTETVQELSNFSWQVEIDKKHLGNEKVFNFYIAFTVADMFPQASLLDVQMILYE